jgi:hypothetical protein
MTFDEWNGYHGWARITCSQLYYGRNKIISGKKGQVTIPTRFIEPGMDCRKMPLSHCASVQPNCKHAFADGTTLSRRPSIVSFKADQSAAEG